MTSLTVGQQGEIVLPPDVLARYDLQADVPVRVIETRNGILLVPLHAGPPSKELQAELDEWSSAGTKSWELFAYEESE